MSAKAALKQAKLAFARGAHAEVVQHCKQALKADKDSYDAYLCALLHPPVLAPCWHLWAGRPQRPRRTGSWARRPSSWASSTRRRWHTRARPRSQRARCRPGRASWRSTPPPATTPRPRPPMSAWCGACTPCRGVRGRPGARRVSVARGAAQLALSEDQEPAARRREYRLGLTGALLRLQDWARAERQLLEVQGDAERQADWVQLQRQLVDVQVVPLPPVSLPAHARFLERRFGRQQHHQACQHMQGSKAARRGRRAWSRAAAPRGRRPWRAWCSRRRWPSTLHPTTNAMSRTS